MSEVLARRYELGAPLGSGGMAKVVQARDLVLDRDVAVKLMRATEDTVARERFLREARSAARFHHPNAVGVYDTGEDGDQPWIAMELVRGESLADRLERGALAPDEATDIAGGVLAPLAAAHRQGMIHRDVKPANILLPDEGGVKLADFGIAKGVQDATVGLTSTGMMVGTATYLAPELVEGQTATAASDVYSLGVVLYEMLAGEPPFAGETAIAVAYAHTAAPVPDLLDLCDAPDWLVAVVERSLAKDPDERYADAGEMLAALRDRTEVLPVAATETVAVGAAASTANRGPSTPPYPRRPPQRAGAGGRRALMWLIGLTVGLLLLVILLSVADDLFEGGSSPGSATPPAAGTADEPQEAPVEPDPDPTGDPEPTGEPEPTPTTEPSPSPTSSPSPDGGILDLGDGE